MPHFPRGTLGLLGVTRCWNWLGGGSKLGISMTLERQETALGPCQADAGDKDW